MLAKPGDRFQKFMPWCPVNVLPYCKRWVFFFALSSLLLQLPPPSTIAADGHDNLHSRKQFVQLFNCHRFFHHPANHPTVLCYIYCVHLSLSIWAFSVPPCHERIIHADILFVPLSRWNLYENHPVKQKKRWKIKYTCMSDKNALPSVNILSA